MISSAKLYGLVRSGGKSTRMGNDKGMIVYHGIPQREYLYNLLGSFCERTFMSVRREQVPDLPSGIETIVDEDVFRETLQRTVIRPQCISKRRMARFGL